MSQKIFIKTFGCQMNEYDSNRILDTVKKIGYEKTEKYEGSCIDWERPLPDTVRRLDGPHESTSVGRDLRIRVVMEVHGVRIDRGIHPHNFFYSAN